MDVKNQLVTEKGLLLSQIAEFAKHGQSREVLAAGEKLHKIENLIERYERLLHDISDLTSPDANPEATPKVGMEARPSSKLTFVPGRGIGKKIRMDFLEKVAKEGIHLEQIRGSVYGNRSGRKVGIAVATERKRDRWFLGLPIGLGQAVLLCQRENEDVAAVCLPKGFVDEYADRMSKRDGQIKFNVVRRGSGYSLLVPGTDGINVSRFVGDYSQLK